MIQVTLGLCTYFLLTFNGESTPHFLEMFLAIAEFVENLGEGVVFLDEAFEVFGGDDGLAAGLVVASGKDRGVGRFVFDLVAMGDAVADIDKLFELGDDFIVGAFGQSLANRVAKIARVAINEVRPGVFVWFAVEDFFNYVRIAVVKNIEGFAEQMEIIVAG